MENFYLKNVAKYHSLLDKLDPTPKIRPSSGRPSPNMTVSARIRPLPETEAFPCAIFQREMQDNVVDIHDLYNHPRGTPVLKSYDYELDRIFDENSSTEKIYDDLVADLVPFAWDGGIGTLFAYGQTGSGKTFTVSRLQQLVGETLMSDPLDGSREMHMTIIDLAGNTAFDLLNERKPISLLEDAYGNTQMHGADEHRIYDLEDMNYLIEQATSFRLSASTFKNDASSRSHAICRIRIRDPRTRSDGLLYLIDLAGSEGARDVSKHGADRMREAREINISLSVLKDCIRGKAKADTISRRKSGGKAPPHIPYRQSYLTKVLKHVFDPEGGRQCKTVVIACVSPSLADVGPSKNTLRFAEMLRVGGPPVKDLDAMAVVNWSNAQVREWIREETADCPISPDMLAPRETGLQLLNLSSIEFEYRCRKCRGVTAEYAKALRSLLWQTHVDSQNRSKRVVSSTSVKSTSTAITPPSPMNGSIPDLSNRMSSRDLDPHSADKPFKERLRPGMVVNYTIPLEHRIAMDLPDGFRLALLLSPSEAIPGVSEASAANEEGPVVKVSSSRAKMKIEIVYGSWLCALLTSGQEEGSWELNIWEQIVIDIDSMVEEVHLEYDDETRYYYLSNES